MSSNEKCTCGEDIEYGQANDVSFGDFCTDVGAKICPKCGILEIWMT